MRGDGHIKRNRIGRRILQVLSNEKGLLSNLGFMPAVISLIAILIFLIELLDVEILNIRAKIGSAPRYVLIVSKYDPRRAGESYPRDPETRRAQMSHVPD